MEFFEIKTLNLQELNELVSLEEEAFKGQGGVDLWILKALIRYGKVFLLKNEEGRFISVIEFMQIFEKKELFLYGISTRKQFRKQGHAKNLLQKSEEYLQKRGYQTIFLTVDPENHIAISFYKGFGYIEVEEEKDEYGEGVHRLLMKKTLQQT